MDSSPPALCNGEHALALIQHQTRRLAALHRDVLADEEREPLHQLRVSLRRLRTALHQFAPALVLPDGVSRARIAALARRTGLTRDLDVLGERLEGSILPRLREAERRALRPALKQLRRERRLAFEAVGEALASSRYLKLLARLGRWQKHPVFTPLGRQPLADWLHEWHRPFSGALFLDPGWQASDPRAEELHGLRKRIKGVRYGLEALAGWLDAPGQDWISALKRAQALLGDLHDLQVLESSLLERPGQKLGGSLEGLRAELEQQRGAVWQEWQGHAAWLLLPESRRALPALTPLPARSDPPLTLP